MLPFLPGALPILTSTLPSAGLEEAVPDASIDGLAAQIGELSVKSHVFHLTEADVLPPSAAFNASTTSSNTSSLASSDLNASFSTSFSSDRSFFDASLSSVSSADSSMSVDLSRAELRAQVTELQDKLRAQETIFGEAREIDRRRVQFLISLIAEIGEEHKALRVKVDELKKDKEYFRTRARDGYKARSRASRVAPPSAPKVDAQPEATCQREEMERRHREELHARDGRIVSLETKVDELPRLNPSFPTRIITQASTTTLLEAVSDYHTEATIAVSQARIVVVSQDVEVYPESRNAALLHEMRDARRRLVVF